MFKFVGTEFIGVASHTVEVLLAALRVVKEGIQISNSREELWNLVKDVVCLSTFTKEDEILRDSACRILSRIIASTNFDCAEVIDYYAETMHKFT